MPLRNIFVLGLSAFTFSLIISTLGGNHPLLDSEFLSVIAALFFGPAIFIALLINGHKLNIINFLGWIIFSGFGFLVGLIATIGIGNITNPDNSNHFDLWFIIPGFLGTLCMLSGFNSLFKLNKKEFLTISFIGGIIGFAGIVYSNMQIETPLFFMTKFALPVILWQTIMGFALGFIVDSREKINSSQIKSPI